MLRVHNYALEIPWAQGKGHYHDTPEIRLKPHQGLPDSFSFFFLLLSGLHTSDDLFGNSTAAQTMQDPGKQTSDAALWNSQVVSVTSGIPILNTIPRPAPGQDILNSPISFAYRTICIVRL